jgi:GT2 family glycosyltransferase
LESLSQITTQVCLPEIIVVDNASIDNTPSEVRDAFPGVEVIVNPSNLGFSAGNNVGVRKALERGNDYVLLLNNDTKVEKNFLDQLVRFAQSKKEAGIVGPVLKFKKGFEVFYDLGGKLNPFFSRTSHVQVSLITDRVPHRVDYLSGACLLIKKEVIEETGYLHEPYFFGFEDVEFCFLSRKGGFYTYIVPNSLIEHKVSSTIGQASPLKIYYPLRNNLYFISRQVSFPFNLLSYLYVTALSIKMFLNSPRFFFPIKDAWRDFLTSHFGQKVI